MARQKAYNESEVLEKAMLLFWRNGYATTSMNMLEEEMGINKFSIYSSFGSKHGLFLESLKCYRKNGVRLFQKLKDSSNGVEGIKEFFYDSLSITSRDVYEKGCLYTNSYYEFAEVDDPVVNNRLQEFMSSLKNVFKDKLRMDPSKDEKTIEKQANYLLLSKHGLATAARVNGQAEIEDYIEAVFKNI